MIDDHCHPFARTGGSLDLATLTLDVGDDPDAPARRARVAGSRLALELLGTRLARFLRCAPEEVPEARATASADWPDYVRRLLTDADLDVLVMDPGSDDRDGGFLAPYAELTGRPLWWLARIDPLVDRLIGDGADVKEIVDGVERFLADAVAAGCAGFKTILAYRTGLAVDPEVTLDAAQQSLAAEAPVRRRGRACRDLVLRQALALAADLGRPIQVHTGFGDSEIRLAEANPLLLEELLRTPEGAAATVVLIHGGYPWHEELAYLAATKPNVFAELSLFNLFSPATTADRVLRVLDLAPADRVLMGTDGHGEPETLWFAACVLRDAWEQVAADLIGVGARPSWVARMRERVFEANARELYAH